MAGLVLYIRGVPLALTEQARDSRRAVDLGRLDSPEEVEITCRSIAMLPPGAPALNREEACAVLEALGAALCRLRVTPIDPRA